MPTTCLTTSTPEPYRLIKQLDTEGFYDVYIAQNVQTGNLYSVKRIERGCHVDQNVFHAIMNHSILFHNHVCRFKEVYVTPRHLCIVTEHGAGGSFMGYLRRHRLNQNEARWFFQQLILAVDHCHMKGVANRNICLERIMLTSDGYPLLKLADFSCSKSESYNTKIGSTVGSPAYLAPEVISQRQGESYDPQKADVWSCGVCLFYIIYRLLPFSDDDDRRLPCQQKLMRMLKKIVDGRFTLPEHPRMSTNFCDLLLKMLQRDPQERISVSGIIQHPWFQRNLPEEALAMNNDACLQSNRTVQPTEEIRRLVAKAKMPSQAQ